MVDGYDLKSGRIKIIVPTLPSNEASSLQDLGWSTVRHELLYTETLFWCMCVTYVEIFIDILMQICCHVVSPFFFFSLEQTFQFPRKILNIFTTSNHQISLSCSLSASGVWILFMGVTLKMQRGKSVRTNRISRIQTGIKCLLPDDAHVINQLTL